MTTTTSRPMRCGTCHTPVHYAVNATSGLWYHDHSGKWQCDDGHGDANTWQIPADRVINADQIVTAREVILERLLRQLMTAYEPSEFLHQLEDDPEGAAVIREMFDV